MRTEPRVLAGVTLWRFGAVRRGIVGAATPRGIALGGAVVALCLRLIGLSHPGHFGGITEYDDAVYFGTAILITHGLLPYRDFVMVQPPGVPVLMIPVAYLADLAGTRAALESTRVITCVVAALDVGLIGYILRRQSRLAISVAVLVAAVFPAFILASQTLLLEPYLDFFCLIGAAMLFSEQSLAASRTRILLAGAAFGAAGAIKLWAVIPFAVLVVFYWRRSWREALYLALGAGAAFAIICLPFLVAAPSRFVREVILDQLGRSDIRVPIATRLGYLGGSPSTLGASEIWLLALLVGAEGALIVLPYLLNRRQPGPLETFAIVTAALIFVSMMIPADFYYHYGAFYAPFFAMALGLSADRWMKWSARPALVKRIGATAVTAMVLACLFYVGFSSTPEVDPSVLVRSLVPKGACVLTDTAEITLLSNRFLPIAKACPIIVDAFGTDLASGAEVAASANVDVSPRLEAFWMAAFHQAQYVVLSDNNVSRIPWTRPLVSYFEAHFQEIGSTGVAVFDRRRPKS